jgi:signal transduction histidine kinase
MSSDLESDLALSLLQISRLAQQGDDPRAALRTVLDVCLQLTAADGGAIELINPDTFALEIEVLTGLPEALRETRLAVGRGVTGWVALHGRPLLVGDVSADPRYVMVDPAIRSELAVPLLDPAGNCLGVINVDSQRLNAFSAHHLAAMEAIAAETTAVLKRIWQVGKLQEKADHLATLIRIGRGLVMKRTLDEVLGSIVDDALVILNASLCVLFEHDATHAVLRPRAARSTAGDATPVFDVIGVDDSALGTALLRRKIVEVGDLRKTGEIHFDMPQLPELVSLMACPVQYEDTVFGVLVVATAAHHRFNNEEKRLFETLAGMGAVAIQNARLYQRIFSGEEQLRQNERLTTLGLLSAEIAHEIRNPLTVIRLLFESLALDFPPGDARQQDVRIIGEKLDQLEQIVARVLSFGKARHELRGRYDLHELLRDTLLLVRMKLHQNGIQLDFQPPTPSDSGPLIVEASKGQLQQAVLNILINATQAMPDGGQIAIQLGAEWENSQRIAVIVIRDTGTGIPAAIRDNLFDSFLSGRSDGTGLGLAIVKRILRSHNGDIEVAASSPLGTAIRLWLPCSHEPGYE